MDRDPPSAKPSGKDLPAETPARVSHRPQVRRTRDTLGLQFAGSAALQSRMSLLNPHALDLDYTRLMTGFLLFNAAPRRMLMIGLGGGSLPKFCHRYLPDTSIDVVEIDPEVIALRDTFHVPPDDARFRVILADGKPYLRARPEPVDVLLLDAYDGKGMPAALCELAFFQDCHAALLPEGMLVVNLHLESASYPVCLEHLREVFGTALLEVIDDDMTNSIVFAGKGEQFDELDLHAALRKPDSMAKDAWRQLMPTFKLIEATLTMR